ncbi:hypothetical protein AADW59_00150 [Candidatus Hodgkinia cicadicola]
MASDLVSIKLLRKLTSVSVAQCRRVLDECDGDIARALKSIRITSASSGAHFEGDLYLAFVYSRLGVCVFKLYANANIFNNRLVWNLRQLLNRTLCDSECDSEVVLNFKQVDGVLVHSCVFLKFDANTYCVYFHNKVCDFVYKKGILLTLSAFNCDKRRLTWLGTQLCKQFLSSVVINNTTSLNLLDCNYIYNEKYNVRQLLELFQHKFECVISLNYSFFVC